MRSSDSSAQRKRLLTAQAALLRLDVVVAREEMRDSLRPMHLLGALARQGKADVGELLGSFRHGAGNTGFRRAGLLSLLEIALPLLPKRRILRALLSRRGAIFAGLAGVAVIGAVLAQRASRSRSRARKAGTGQEPAPPDVRSASSASSDRAD